MSEKRPVSRQKEIVFQKNPKSHQLLPALLLRNFLMRGIQRAAFLLHLIMPVLDLQVSPIQLYQHLIFVQHKVKNPL